MKRASLRAFTLDRSCWPLTALDLVRILLAIPVEVDRCHIFDVDRDAGTFRWVRG